MIRDFFKLVQFDLYKIYRKRYILVFWIICIVYLSLSCVMKQYRNNTITDIIAVLQMNEGFGIVITCIVGIFLALFIFIEKDNCISVYMRVNSKRKWMLSKVVSIIWVNMMLFLCFFIITSIIGIIYGEPTFKLSVDFGEQIGGEYIYMSAYPIYKIVLVNAIVFITFTSSLGFIAGWIYIKCNKAYVGISIVIFYLLSSCAVTLWSFTNPILRYFNAMNYISLGSRNFYNTINETQYFTEGQVVCYTSCFMIIVIIYLIVRAKSIKCQIGKNVNE